MSETAKPRIAVIGLGSMGFGMATSLRRAGFDVTGCDVSADSVARFVADGGKGAKTPAEAAKSRRHRRQRRRQRRPDRSHPVRRGRRRRNAGQGRRVHLLRHHGPGCRAAAGASSWRRPGGIISMRRSRGGAQRAAQGELTILASGSPAAFAKARPALDAMAAKLYELGDAAGQGAAFKMINQLLAGVHIAAASRGDRVRRQAGPRYPQGLRSDHGVGRQFLDVREPHAACARRRLHAAQCGGHLRQGPRHHPGHGAHGEISGAGVGRRAADVPDDRRRPAWAATTTPRWRGCMPASPARICRASRSRIQQEDSRCPASPPISR